jgi:hypothetical protein
MDPLPALTKKLDQNAAFELQGQINGIQTPLMLFIAVTIYPFYPREEQSCSTLTPMALSRLNSQNSRFYAMLPQPVFLYSKN